MRASTAVPVLVLAALLSGCFVIGGAIGATSAQVHNHGGDVRAGTAPPVSVLGRAGRGALIGLVVDAVLLTVTYFACPDAFGEPPPDKRGCFGIEPVGD